MKKTLLLIALGMAILFTSCNKDDGDNNNPVPTSSISIKLVDEPGDYDNVFIDVKEVEIIVNDETSSRTLTTDGGIYDLLELTGGVEALLVDTNEIPSGVLNEIRLVLGENNTVVIDGETFPLKTPSAQQSGLKIKINQELIEGITYTFILDFNVDKSIVIAGNSGNINLKPVIRASVEALTGAFRGNVIPSDVLTEVLAVKGNDILTTTTNEGDFFIHGVEAGQYKLIFNPEAESGYIQSVIELTSVQVGKLTAIRDFELTPTN
jgi:hypothetical protein